jgi:hypothetical protein
MPVLTNEEAAALAVEALATSQEGAPPAKKLKLTTESGASVFRLSPELSGDVEDEEYDDDNEDDDEESAAQPPKKKILAKSQVTSP